MNNIKKHVDRYSLKIHNPGEVVFAKGTLEKIDSVTARFDNEAQLLDIIERNYGLQVSDREITNSYNYNKITYNIEVLYADKREILRVINSPIEFTKIFLNINNLLTIQSFLKKYERSTYFGASAKEINKYVSSCQIGTNDFLEITRFNTILKQLNEAFFHNYKERREFCSMVIDDDKFYGALKENSAPHYSEEQLLLFLKQLNLLFNENQVTFFNLGISKCKTIK